MRHERVERDARNCEGFLRRRRQHDWRSHASLVSFVPSRCAQAPPVARNQPGEPPLRPRRRQVVACRFGKRQELRRDARRDEVPAVVLVAGAAVAVAIPAGDGVGRAFFERGAKDVEASAGEGGLVGGEGPGRWRGGGGGGEGEGGAWCSRTHVKGRSASSAWDVGRWTS